MKYRCPKCKRLIYDRRHKNCGFCNAELPPELLFTKEELAQLERETAKIEEDRRQLRILWDKDKEAAEKKRRRGGVDSVPPMLGS